MHVEFHGAAHTVTGSCTLLEAAGTRLLVDCGQFQGDDDLERRNRGDRLGFDPASINAVVLTHAHIDHIGRSPLLSMRGFHGRVYCTRATGELANVMLLDSAKIQEEDHKRGGPQPIYGEREVEAFCSLIRPVNYRQPIVATPAISFALSDAGHILGSAHALVTMKEGSRTVVFGVSGDIGSPGRPVVADPTPFPSADYVQIESTYGDRDHKSQEDSIAELHRILAEADQGNGIVVIPAFALGRTQELLYHINGWKEHGQLKDLKVYVDSPLATRVTTIFRGNPGIFDADAKGLLKHGDDPFQFEGLHYVGSHEESERLSHEATRAVFIASSGMCQSGRVLGHLAHLLPRSSTKVLIVGYQAPGTLGRRLVDGAKTVNVRGHPVPVNASIHTLGGFSAHGGQSEMLDWLSKCGGTPKKVFLCHGEPRTLETFAAAIRDRLHLATYIPQMDERVEL
jgi:metallo-beta-lactamase family protein